MKIINVALGTGFVLLMFAACSDNVTISNDITTSFESIEALEDATCAKDNQGAKVFVRNEGKMYVCANSAWTTINDPEIGAILASSKTFLRKVALQIPMPREINVDSGSIALVTLYELNKKADTTGRKCFYKVPLQANWNSQETSTSSPSNSRIVKMLSLEGEITVNSLVSPIALIQIDFSVDNFTGDSTIREFYGNTISYQAYANLETTNFLKVSAFTNFEKKRIQDLVASGQSLETATKKINEEFYDSMLNRTR